MAIVDEVKINGQTRSNIIGETSVSLSVAKTRSNILIFERSDGQQFRMSTGDDTASRLWDFLNG